ncbi:MAG: hypothetical protein PHN84_14345 [Desulfuromonadaceae bacterium]|nr:hypothetical protein [Desulfuromonadaceae bacterium]
MPPYSILYRLDNRCVFIDTLKMKYLLVAITVGSISLISPHLALAATALFCLGALK